MIEILECNKNNNYCNVCQKSNKDKYYQVQFLSPINQGVSVNLCCDCLSDLKNKLSDNKYDLEVKKDGLNMKSKEVIIQIAKMIASGKIPNELYDEYLSDCPIGFMSEKKLIDFFTQDLNRLEELKND